MDVVSALLADAQPIEVREPRQRGIYRSSVSSQPLARLDALKSDAWDDVALPKAAPDDRGAVPLVVVSRLGPLPRPIDASVVGRPDGVQELKCAFLVVDDCCRQQHGRPTASRVCRDMVLGALFPSVRGVRAGLGSPFFTRMLPEPNAARHQSIRARMPNSSRCSCGSHSTTSTRIQPSSRHQQVISLASKTSADRSLQAISVLSTGMTPCSAVRTSQLGRLRAQVQRWQRGYPLPESIPHQLTPLVRTSRRRGILACLWDQF